MIKLTVKDGKIETKMTQEGKYPIFEELGNGIAQLLAEFQAELLRRGNSEEEVRSAYSEMMSVIMAQNDERVWRILLGDNLHRN